MLLAVAALWLPLRRGGSPAPRPRAPLLRFAAAAGALLFCAQALAACVILAGGGGAASSLVSGVKLRSLSRTLLLATAGAMVWLAASPAAGRWAARGLSSTRGVCALATLAAASLALGPTIRSLGRPLMDGPYAILYAWLPGFDGLRVPARFAMLAALFLALLAGFGAAELRA